MNAQGRLPIGVAVSPVRSNQRPAPTGDSSLACSMLSAHSKRHLEVGVGFLLRLRPCSSARNSVHEEQRALCLVSIAIAAGHDRIDFPDGTAAVHFDDDRLWLDSLLTVGDRTGKYS